MQTFSLGPYSEGRKKHERGIYTEVSHSEFMEDPTELFESTLLLIELRAFTARSSDPSLLPRSCTTITI